MGHKGTLGQETAFSPEDKGKRRHRVSGVAQGSHDLECTVEEPEGEMRPKGWAEAWGG